MNNLRRKPVGADDSQQESTVLEQENAAPPPLPRRPVPMPQVSAENMSFAGAPVANATPIPEQAGLNAPGDSVVQHTVPRRPLPPVPASEEPWRNAPTGEDGTRKTGRWSAFAERGFESWKEKNGDLTAGRLSLDSSRPKLPPRPSNDRPGSPQRKTGQSPPRQRRPQPPQRADPGFHITLIRRDPASGTQWNVGTISTPRLDRNVIDIDISTRGYNRFATSNEPLSLASLAANLPPAMLRNAGSLPQPIQAGQQDQPAGPRIFHRQLCVSKPLDDATGSDLTGPDGLSSSKLKSGYYVFNSPWNGTCTFASSVNGRSLKCKHMIPGPSGQAQTGEGDINPAVTVAEIRFNTPFQAANLHHHTAPRSHPQHTPLSTQFQRPILPPSRTSHDSSMSDSYKRQSFAQLFNPNTYSRPRAHSGSNTSENQRQSLNPSTLGRRSSMRTGPVTHQNHLQGYPQPRRSTSASSGGVADSDEERLDLSLAREPAGGGMRGKSAKLGKLIIEDEGIKMLDLVVAACMAVWWRGYYH